MVTWKPISIEAIKVFITSLNQLCTVIALRCITNEVKLGGVWRCTTEAVRLIVNQGLSNYVMILSVQKLREHLEMNTRELFVKYDIFNDFLFQIPPRWALKVSLVSLQYWSWCQLWSQSTILPKNTCSLLWHIVSDFNLLRDLNICIWHNWFLKDPNWTTTG